VSAAKTERLINLTMALLGTKRHMTKSEIFRKVAGYTGAPEAMERMFERDKDELRSLGIDIEVTSNDPLFEDEVGYRISPDRFSMKPIFTPEELGILATAINHMNVTDFAEDAQRIALKIDTLQTDSPPNVDMDIDNSILFSSGLKAMSIAISLQSEISFDYQKSDDAEIEGRNICPMGLSAWKGDWYLVGFDINRNDYRVFKLSRIRSAVNISPKRGSFLIPHDFNVRDHLIMYTKSQYLVTAQIRKNTCHSLRERAQRVESIDQEFDFVEIDFVNEEDALHSVLWFCDDIKVIEPSDFSKRLESALESLVKKHA
jgi:proteasome accessory factor B